MPEIVEKFVDFKKWCPKCKYIDLKEDEDPCDHCLEEPVSTNSTKPVRFKEMPKEEKDDRANKTNNKCNFK